MDDKKTVLLVESDPRSVMSFSSFFSNKRYRVETAKNGEEALRKLGQYGSGICGILADMDLPENPNGIDLVRQIEQLGRNYPLILMSGSYGKIDYLGGKLKPLRTPVSFGDLEKAVRETFH